MLCLQYLRCLAGDETRWLASPAAQSYRTSISRPPLLIGGRKLETREGCLGLLGCLEARYERPIDARVGTLVAP